MTQHHLPLAGLRVLELASGVAAAYAGRLLAQFGADVVKVEPPEGDTARRVDLIGAGDPDPEASAVFLYLNAAKQSVVLDLATAPGRSRLAALAERADLVLEDTGPERLAALGVRERADLVRVHVSPFGTFGPYRDWKSTSLTMYAIGGQMQLAGEPDGPPMKTYGYQPEYQAGLHAFSAAVTGLFAVARGERAQGVEIATMEVEAAQQESPGPDAWLHGLADRRYGGQASPTWGFYAVKDGYIGLFAMEPNMRQVANAIEFPALVEDPQFSNRAERMAGADVLFAVISAWASEHTRESAFEVGGEARAPIAQVLPVPSLLDWPGLVEKGFWNEVEHPVAGRYRYPGAALTPGEGEVVYGPAPLLGSAPDEPWAAREPRAGLAPPSPRGPLAGIRVVDLTMVWSGPWAASLLADMGADVIKIEGPDNLDPVRPFGERTQDELDGIYSPYLNQYSRGKRGLCLDLKSERGRELVLQLVAQSDLVIENFRAGVLERLGLGYDVLRAVKPDIVLVSMPGYASTGVEKDRAAYGPVVESMAGFVGLGGIEGEPPLFSGVSYSDPVAGTYAAGAAVLGLLHRVRTGRGQRLELSQRDNMINQIGEVTLEYQLSGEVPRRLGNRHPRWAPQGAYRCRDLDHATAPKLSTGEPVWDRWVTLSVTNDAQWQALCRVIDRDDLGADPRFAHEQGRRNGHDEIDAAISAWTANLDCYAAAHDLQAAGVPAGPVLMALDTLTDPHLVAREFLDETDHPRAGKQLLSRPLWRLSETPLHIARAAPLLGQHNDEILGDLLGLGADEIAALADARIIRYGPGPTRDQAPGERARV